MINDFLDFSFAVIKLFLWKRPSLSNMITSYADSVTKIKMSGY